MPHVGYAGASRGAWRSLVSALVWGTRGPRFESGRPDWNQAGSALRRVVNSRTLRDGSDRGAARTTRTNAACPHESAWQLQACQDPRRDRLYRRPSGDGRINRPRRRRCGARSHGRGGLRSRTSDSPLDSCLSQSRTGRSRPGDGMAARCRLRADRAGVQRQREGRQWVQRSHRGTLGDAGRHARSAPGQGLRRSTYRSSWMQSWPLLPEQASSGQHTEPATPNAHRCLDRSYTSQGTVVRVALRLEKTFSQLRQGAGPQSNPFAF